MKRTVSLLVIVGLVIFGVSGGAYLKSEREDPENVFKAMLNNSLRTTSVTRTVNQSDGQQSLEQYVRFQPTGEHIAYAKTVLEQQGEQTAQVTTENIGTPYTDYIQYTSIESDQENEAGETVEFDEVLNTWGQTESEDSDATTGELYNEIALAAVPFGNLSAEDRKQLLEFIEEEAVYTVDYATVNKTSVNGRQIYVYPVTVQPQAYIGLLREYASIVGLRQLEDVDPAVYADSQPLQLTISIDALTQRITGISYPNGRTERYGSYGVMVRQSVPENSIPLSELQSKIQSLQ